MFGSCFDFLVNRAPRQPAGSPAFLSCLNAGMQGFPDLPAAPVGGVHHHLTPYFLPFVTKALPKNKRLMYITVIAKSQKFWKSLDPVCDEITVTSRNQVKVRGFEVFKIPFSFFL
ncbi:MAG: hypothetical protein K1Y36_00625 [Blastocatellia bacterium]|nr:hypothetical protein [Blastocatellia bacterium]